MGEEAASRLNLDYSSDHNRLYAASCKEAAKELGLPVVDTWTIMQDEEVGPRLHSRCAPVLQY